MLHSFKMTHCIHGIQQSKRAHGANQVILVELGFENMPILPVSQP